MKTLVRALGLSLAAVLASSAIAAASTPISVGYTGCALGSEQASVPADSAVSLRFGFASDTPSQARSIVAAMVVYVAIDAAGAIVAGTFGAPVAAGDQWVTTWTYDTGHTLASGQSMTVSVAPYATRKVWDGSRDVNNKPLKFGPGFVFFGQGTSCTITAS